MLLTDPELVSEYLECFDVVVACLTCKTTSRNARVSPIDDVHTEVPTPNCTDKVLQMLFC